MKTEQIKSYREFIDKAASFYWDFLREDLGALLMLREAKVDFSSEVFCQKRELFEKELFENMQIYSDNSIIAEYIKSQFSQFTDLSFVSFDNKSIIIGKEVEIEFMLNLESNLAGCYRNLNGYLYYNFNEGDYPDLSELRKQLSKAQDNLLSSESDSSESKLSNEPARDSRFDFNLLKVELNAIDDHIDKIKLIRRRMHELDIWEKQCDTMEYSLEIEKWDYIYSRKYYPKFRELCKLEINHIEEELKFEERRQKSIAQQPVVQTVALPRKKLLWTKSSREFVETFHKLIENKKISLNGNYDLEPIARVLLETFDIPKGKGTGFVNEESMLTYFRKEHSGDLY